MNDKGIFRIRLISFGLLTLFALIIAKLYVVQIVRADIYAEKADRQYVRPTNDLFDRGSIFFTTRDGEEITAAGLRSGFILALNPTRIKDAEDTYAKLSAFIELDHEDFMSKARKKSDPYEEIARRIETDLGLQIDEAQIPGVNVYKERWRFYPGDNTAPHLLGFLSYKGDELGAHYGLESWYDETLSRSDNNAYANFFTEIFYGLRENVLGDKDFEGDIVLTIEPTVQGYLEDTVEKTKKRWDSAETGGIIIDPKTGKIYAMALSPSFNPNDTSAVEDIEIFSNSLVEDVYEMGSIVKPLTVAAGLDAGVITARTTFNDKGSASFDRATIYNYDKKARGIVDIQTALNQSLNTGMAFIVGELGKNTFTEYMKKFGIDKRTGIDLPYESAPLVKNLDSNRMIEHVTASYGQGIAFTPIGITRALATLGNGGYQITPYLVDKIHLKIGPTQNVAEPKGPQVIKPETSEEITRMLVEVVDTALLGGEIKKERYAIAAKTGTAQISRPEGGGYYEDRYLHSFFGYFPAYDPQFLIFLYTVYPKGVDYASNTLTSPFNDLVQFLLSYYNVPPDR